MTRSASLAVFALTLAASGVLLLGCRSGTPGPGEAGPHDAYVVVQIVGVGSVRYDPPLVIDCANEDPLSVETCDPVLWHEGFGTVIARPARGWMFSRWFLPMGGISRQEIVITNPLEPTQIIAEGVAGALGCSFVQRVGALRATFDEANFRTTYESFISNPRGETLHYQWSGPGCGSWSPQTEGVTNEPVLDISMDWTHPHPPCGPTPNHSDTTITLTVWGWSDGAIVTCTYQGAASGTGPPCTQR